MLKILDRYIAKIIIQATLVTALIMTGILLLINLLGELKDIGTGDYGMLHAIAYVLLRLPENLYQFSPMMLLLSAMVGLSLLASYREITVMRTAGMSQKKLLLSIFWAALMLSVIVTSIGELLGPQLSYRALLNKENAKNAGQVVVTASGVWFHIDDNFIHVKNVIGRDLLQEVTRYEFDKSHQLKTAYYANTLTYADHDWTMRDGVMTNFFPNQTKSRAFTQMPLNLSINPNLLTAGILEPNEMTLTRLHHFTSFLEKNGLQSAQYRFVFWQRVFQPLAAIIMMFLAIPFVLKNFHQKNLGVSVIIGVAFGFVFFILNALLGQFSIVYQCPPFFAAFIPIILFGGLAGLLIKKL